MNTHRKDGDLIPVDEVPSMFASGLAVVMCPEGLPHCFMVFIFSDSSLASFRDSPIQRSYAFVLVSSDALVYHVPKSPRE